jgi:hypothetical protein
MTTDSGEPLGRFGSDRDAAIGRIQDAFARGDISYQDLDQRISSVLSARTPDEVQIAVGSLPMPPEGRVVTIATKSGRIRRDGEWRVPRVLHIESEYSKVILDFSRATFETPIVDVELYLRFGGARIVVPDNLAVDLDGLRAEWKQPRYALPIRGPAARPLIRIAGSMEYGRLRVRRCQP